MVYEECIIEKPLFRRVGAALISSECQMNVVYDGNVYETRLKGRARLVIGNIFKKKKVKSLNVKLSCVIRYILLKEAKIVY